MAPKSKGELLEHYNKREPKSFVQIDCWHSGRANGSFLSFARAHADENGRSMCAGMTTELIHGAHVRILIDPNTPHEEAVALLQNATEWLKRDMMENGHRSVIEFGRCPDLACDLGCQNSEARSDQQERVLI